MNAKLISGVDLHLIQYYDQIAKNSETSACCTSHLSFGSSISKAKPRVLVSSCRASSASFRTRAKVRAMAASAANAFYAPAETRETFYELLGISESGTLPEIKKAYKQLARKYHPDVSPPERIDENTKRFILVQEAYETLSDPQSRASYDRDLARGMQMAFSSRRKSHYDERWVEAEEWKTRWLSQLMGLERRSKNRDSNRAGGGKMSWGARMRRQRNDIFDLGFN